MKWCSWTGSSRSTRIRETARCTAWSVTYERWTHEDAEIGDTDDKGYLEEKVSFQDAMRAMQQNEPENLHSIDADSSPLSQINPPRWITLSGGWDMGGKATNISLHFPPHITFASRMRVARMLGVRGA